MKTQECFIGLACLFGLRNTVSGRRVGSLGVTFNGALKRTLLALWGLVLLSMPMAAQDQFSYQIANGTITIIGYTGPGGALIVPSALTGLPGLPVTGIGYGAFYDCTSLTSVTIPGTVTSIGAFAFNGCTNLTSVIIPGSVTYIGADAFYECASLTSVTIPGSVASIEFATFQGCTGLTNATLSSGLASIGAQAFKDCASLSSVTIPNTVTSIGQEAFYACEGLTSVTIPGSVTDIGTDAFADCTGLRWAYFEGNAPSHDSTAFQSDHGIVYYLPGTGGWGSTYGGLQTALWPLSYALILTGGPGFGVQTNGFGFTVSWSTNLPVVVEASTTLANPVWTPVATNTLTGGSCYFTDPQWRHFPARFYRITSP